MTSNSKAVVDIEDSMDDPFHKTRLKVVVLDMDETLISSCVEKVDRYWKKLDPWNMHPSSRCRLHKILGQSPYFFYERPHLHSFLEELDRVYDHVVIYSAGSKDYVNEVIKSIFVGHNQPSLILTSDDCVKHEGGGGYRKCLNLVIRRLKQSSLIDDRHRDEDVDIVLIDDRYDNFSGDESRGIHVKSFDIKFNKNNIDIEDDVLRLLVLNMKKYNTLSHLAGKSIGID